MASIMADEWELSRSSISFLVGSFTFRNDEKSFVVNLLENKPNLWVFRCNQRKFCGDFVIVDMSSPAPELRRVVVLDLKQGASLKRGGGGAGIQLQNARSAVQDIAQKTSIIPSDVGYELMVGDRKQVQGALGLACQRWHLTLRRR